MRRQILTLLLLAALVAPLAACAADGLKIERGLSFVISPGYHDTLVAANPDGGVMGGYGWMGLHLGLRYMPVEQVIVTPRARLLFNYLSGAGGGGS